MSLKNLTRSIVLAALAAACAAVAPAETTAGDNRSTSSAATQSDLIGELLGIAGSKSTQEALSPRGADDDAVMKLAARQPEKSAQPATAKGGSQNGDGALGAMFGRLIRIDVDTNTVDIQFDGSRQTTVGSKFSVEHDYAFTTEYLGKIEVIYLAGGNRAIAKPVDKSDITKMGKGDRVGGRIVPNPKGTSASGATQSAAGDTSPRAGAPQAQKQSCPAPSCVKPPARKSPQAPPDTAMPYAPGKDGVWKGPLAHSWGSRLNRNSPAKVLVTRRSPPTPTTLPWRSKSLWCAVQPKPVASPSPTQTAALPARPTPLPAVVLFESE